MIISVIAITDANRTRCLCTYGTQLMDEYFAGESGTLFVFL